MMRYSIQIFLVLFFLAASDVYSQSVGAYAGYPYYFIDHGNYSSDTRVSNRVNYIFGITALSYFNKVSIEIGYSYSTKNFKYDFSATGKNLISKEITSNIHSIPILVSPKLFSNKRNIGSLVTGVIIHKPAKYIEKSFFRDGKTMENEGSRFDFGFGASARLGLKYTRVVKNNLLFFASLNTNYKFIKDYSAIDPVTTPAEDKLSINVNLGMEILLFDEIKYFKFHKARR